MSDDPNLYDYALPEGMLLNSGCYRIKRKIGQGGFGITYLALQVGFIEDIGDGQTRFRRLRDPEEVVIKELFYEDFCRRDGSTFLVSISQMDKKVDFEKLVNKQVEEGRILRRLNHPNIVVNRKIFEENGTAYIVMDYIEGFDLEKVLDKETVLPVDTAIRYITQILQALQYIQEQDPKVMHLDIKPSNIFIRKRIKVTKDDDTAEILPDDSAVLIDFGASLTYDENNKVKSTTSKLISGISSYAPIEQRDLSNLKVFDASLDTFSLAGTFFHCITGYMPASPSLRISGHSELVLPTSFEGNESMSDYLDAICIKGLKINSKERFSSAKVFLDAFENQKVYTAKIAGAEKQIEDAEFKAAIALVQDAAALVLPTKTTDLLIKKCNELALADSKQNTYDMYWKNALALEDKLDYENALQQYQLANATISNKKECLEKIAFCQDKIAEKHELEKKQRFASLLNNAAQLYADGSFVSALRMVDEALTLYPDDEQVLELLDKINIQQKEQQKRQSFFEWVDKATKLQGEGKHQEALQAINKALALYPADIYANEFLKKIKDSLDKTELINNKTEPKNEPSKTQEPIKPVEPIKQPAKPTRPVTQPDPVKPKVAEPKEKAAVKEFSSDGPDFFKRYKTFIFIAAAIIVVLAILIWLGQNTAPIDAGQKNISNKAADSTTVHNPDTAKKDTTPVLGSPATILSAAHDSIKSGSVTDTTLWCTLIRQHPNYKQELVTQLAVKAQKIGKLSASASEPFRKAAVKLYNADSTKINLNKKLYNYIMSTD